MSVKPIVSPERIEAARRLIIIAKRDREFRDMMEGFGFEQTGDSPWITDGLEELFANLLGIPTKDTNDDMLYFVHDAIQCIISGEGFCIEGKELRGEKEIIASLLEDAKQYRNTGFKDPLKTE